MKKIAKSLCVVITLSVLFSFNILTSAHKPSEYENNGWSMEWSVYNDEGYGHYHFPSTQTINVWFHSSVPSSYVTSFMAGFNNWTLGSNKIAQVTTQSAANLIVTASAAGKNNIGAKAYMTTNPEGDPVLGLSGIVTNGHLSRAIIWINTSYSSDYSTAQKTGIGGHELGHTLGFQDIQATVCNSRIMYWRTSANSSYGGRDVTSPSTYEKAMSKAVTGLGHTHNWVVTDYGLYYIYKCSVTQGWYQVIK